MSKREHYQTRSAIWTACSILSTNFIYKTVLLLLGIAWFVAAILEPKE